MPRHTARNRFVEVGKGPIYGWFRRIYDSTEQAHFEQSQPAYIPPQQTTAIAGRNDIGPDSLTLWHAADLRKLAKARGVEVADLYTQTNLTTVGVSVELLWNVLETVKDNKEPDELQRGREVIGAQLTAKQPAIETPTGAVRSLKLGATARAVAANFAWGQDYSVAFKPPGRARKGEG